MTRPWLILTQLIMWALYLSRYTDIKGHMTNHKYEECVSLLRINTQPALCVSVNLSWWCYWTDLPPSFIDYFCCFHSHTEKVWLWLQGADLFSSVGFSTLRAASTQLWKNHTWWELWNNAASGMFPRWPVGSGGGPTNCWWSLWVV